MITRSTHHLGLRAEDGRLCEASVAELHIIEAMLPYFAEQQMRRPRAARPCADCLAMFWLAANEVEGVH
jgi:hypothetical protein